MRALMGVVLVACSACSAHRFECTAHGGVPAYTVESQHFLVTGQLDPETLRLEVSRLERLWDAFSVFFQHEPAESTARLEVVMMSPGAPDEFVENTGGFITSGDEPVLVSSRDGEGSSNAHELVHLVSQSWLPRQPRWLAEALAEYLGDAEFVSAGTVRFGRWRFSEVDGVATLPELWEWKPRNTDETRRLYFSSWAWLHYFANRDEARLEQLWNALRQPTEARSAFEAVFPPVEWASLQQRVVSYVDARRYSGWQSTTRRAPVVSAARELAPWEVHLVRRKVFAELGERKRAERESAMALSISPTPTPPPVAIARAVDTLAGPERTDALEPYRGYPDGALAWALGVDHSRAAQLDALNALRARTPESVRALLAFANVAKAIDDRRGLEAAQRARVLAPWSFAAAWLEATLLITAGRCSEAQLATQYARSLSYERSGAESATNTLQQALDACEERP